MKNYLRLPVVPVLFAAILSCGASQALPVAAAERPPNILMFMADNLGYGDIGPFGSTLHRTPNLDRLAAEGRKLTHFYVAGNTCTPSRAALMTGAYPKRVNLYQNVRSGAVLQPGEPIGLHPSEITVAQVLKGAGYTTMLIGKWHLGDQPPFLPTRQGFDEYWGVPYSDDMTPREGQNWPPLPLMRNEVVIEAPVDRNELTRRETEEAIRFITENRSRPFFLLISHAMPGSTQTPFSSAAFRGKSRNGDYGDSVEELDWSAGQVMDALRGLGLDENTLVIWAPDNTALQRNPPQGSNRPFSGFLHGTNEGGMRIPFIARWPGRIPAGTASDELASMMDLLPTFAHLAGVQPPSDRVIDGRNIWPLLDGSPGARTPHEAFYYYQYEQLQAVRSGPWKLFVPLEQRRVRAARPLETVNSPARLYHLIDDPAEQDDLAARHPRIVARLMALAEAAREDLGDLGRIGRGQRPAGWVSDPQPQRLPESD